MTAMLPTLGKPPTILCCQTVYQGDRWHGTADKKIVAFVPGSVPREKSSAAIECTIIAETSGGRLVVKPWAPES